ncbi:MAG TPA: hypothetical protein DDW76_36525 [Cyanobacteria bacterium UBA11369]|nr:hypothetical protein [Cyanobacteria bacterium UBA11371]HBE36863.1 hypothetical protein [Cyanobacteria bacterium UBA11368]HBE54112.1 hypothetical protein [Cyanobacteria bacterium UBA11369]
MKPVDELRHLFAAPSSEDEVEGAGIILFNVYCPGNANEVLQNCREVLAVVLQQYEKNWPSDDEWQELLPKWFVERCAPERTIEEEEENLAKWRTLSREEQIREIEEELWSVMDWISWFEPSDDPFEQRCWFWWDAFVKDPNLLLIAVEVVDVPFPFGSLEWLIRASGAIKLEEAKDVEI